MKTQGSRRRFTQSLIRPLALLVTQALVSVAFAGGGGVDFEGILGSIPETICNAANFLAGPVGAAIVVVVFVIGLIRMAAGNRGGLGLIITAFVIGLVLVAAPQIVALFTGGDCALA